MTFSHCKKRAKSENTGLARLLHVKRRSKKDGFFEKDEFFY
jgi:hypothetical protein